MTRRNEANAAAGQVVASSSQTVASSPTTTTATTKTKTATTTPTMTRRQRRKHLGDQKHVWPQHANIRSSAAREQAYLRTAGLGRSLDNNNNTSTTVDLHVAQACPQHWCRVLASPDARIRHAAIQQLQSYIKGTACSSTGGAGISELDWLKWCKAAWYTIYMADRPVVQEQLCHMVAQFIWCVAGTEEEDEYAGQAYMNIMSTADDDEEEEEDDEGDDEGEEVDHYEIDEDDDDNQDDDDGPRVTLKEMVNTLDSEDSNDDDDEESDEHESENCSDDNDQEMNDSEIPHCRGAHLASLFVRTLFRTIRREWGNLDKYRVDKFYTLMRLVLREIFCYMARRHWNLGIIRLFNDALFDEVLSQTPNGLRWHLIDVALEELAKVNASQAPMPLTEATFLDVLEPYFGLLQTGDVLVQQRVVQNILEKFLTEYSIVSDRAVAASDNNKTTHRDDDKEKKRAGNDDDQKDDGRSLVMDQVHVGTVAQFIFDVASDGATKDSYRAGLYQLHKMYLRRVKQVGRDVQLDDENFEDDDEEEEECCDEQHEHQHMEEEEEDMYDDEVAPASGTVDKKEVKGKRENEPDSKEKKKKSKKRKQVVESGKVEPAGKEEEKQEPKNDESASDKKKKQKRDKKSKPTVTDMDASKDELVDKAVADTDASKDEPVEKAEVEPEKDESALDNKKKRKRNKKKKKTQEADDVGEKEITITLKDQAKAKAALKSCCSAKNCSEPTGPQIKKHELKTEKSASPSSSGKRVKFGAQNRSRSWKASMKGLRTMDSPVTNVTPEKGILLKKEAKSEFKLSKKARRASDYF